ncbi:MAG TPA: flagellar biosynthesis protein FlhB, partial [Geobacter sp.]|nr:flagellar biosynthesis protein FlhB [Geobacter sp.]
MSQMLTSSLTLLVGIVSLYIFGSFMMDGLKKSSVDIFSSMGTFKLTEANLHILMIKLFGTIVLLLTPLIITIIATSMLS